MKNILSLIILLSIQCTAQSNIVPLTECNKQFNRSDGTAYLKDTNNEIDQYAGVWKWTGGNKEFTLTLIKQVKHHFNQSGNNNHYEDRLVGYYKVKENGVTIADTSTDDLSKDFGVKVQFRLNCHNRITSLRFNDYLKDKSYDVYLEKISPTQLKFHGKREEFSFPNTGTVTVYGGNTFPLEMTLIKQ